MLNLFARKFSSLYPNYYSCLPTHAFIREVNRSYSHYNVCYSRCPSSMGMSDLFLKLNGFNLKRKYLYYNDCNVADDITIIKEELLSTFNSISATDIELIKVVTTNDYFTTTQENLVDTDLWIECNDNIKEILNKVVAQTTAREKDRGNLCYDNTGAIIPITYKLYLSRDKHMLLYITNYEEYTQDMDEYTLIGLLPDIYEDIKSKLTCDEEIKFFKELVHRGTLKHVVNNVTEECFNTAASIEKYTSLIKDIEKQNMINTLSKYRLQYAKNKLSDIRHSISNLLRDYEKQLEEEQKQTAVVTMYEERADSIEEEIKTALTTEGVEDFKQIDDSIVFTFKVPLNCYDMDTAELFINNPSRTWRNELTKKLLTDLYIDQKYKLNVVATGRFNFNPNNGFRNFGFVDENVLKENNALFNPHFHFYSCMGNYEAQLIKAMKQQDLLIFVNLAMVATKSINFADGAVTGRWVSWFDELFNNLNPYYMSIKCLVDKDGNELSLTDWVNTLSDHQINIIEPVDTLVDYSEVFDEYTEEDDEDDEYDEYDDEDMEEDDE